MNHSQRLVGIAVRNSDFARIVSSIILVNAVQNILKLRVVTVSPALKRVYSLILTILTVGLV
tara:strand:+ start:430 stop:615 length:186 start_codon:yes stop_codon:yes gene_type:complete